MSEGSATAERILTEEAFAYFCTTDTRNRPHVVPVFFVFDLTRCHAYFLFSRDSKNVRNMQLRPKICFTVDVRDHVNPLENKGVMIQGEAKADLSNIRDVDREYVKHRFEEKYGWSSSQSFFRHEHAERILVEVAVRKIAYWEGPKFLSCPSFCMARNRHCCGGWRDTQR